MIPKTRKERHIKKLGRFQPKILAIILGALFLIVGLSVILFTQLGHHPKDTKKERQTNEVALLSTIKKDYFSKEAPTQTVSNATETAAKQIFLIDTHLSDDIKQSLIKPLDESLKKWNIKQDDLVLSYAYLKEATKTIRQMNAITALYRWNEQKSAYVLIHKKELATNYLNINDGSLVSTKTILQNEANLSLIRWVSQKEYLNQSKDKEAVLDDILNLPSFTWETVIDYTPKYLFVHLPDFGQLKNQTVKIPYEKITSVVDPSYIDPKIADKIAETNKQPATKKQIALTFDDGPNPKVTPKILATLKEKNAKATFFQLGKNAKEYPELVKKVVGDGHELGSHTFNHESLPRLAPKMIQKELVDTDKAIYTASGVLPYLIRPPYGATNATVTKIADRPLIMWNIDSEDWKNKNAEKTFNQIKQTIKPNGIILMHDIQPSTAEALPKLIDWLYSEGYQLVTVSELFDNKERPLNEYFSKIDQRQAS